jgi:hypothetical protein
VVAVGTVFGRRLREIFPNGDVEDGEFDGVVEGILAPSRGLRGSAPERRLQSSITLQVEFEVRVVDSSEDPGIPMRFTSGKHRFFNLKSKIPL